MAHPYLAIVLLFLRFASPGGAEQVLVQEQVDWLREACPAYDDYSQTAHRPLSSGPLELPYQRPDRRCRTFHSAAIERVIEEVTSQMKDPDLARLFENTFPSTVDTTIAFHTNGNVSAFVATPEHLDARRLRRAAEWEGPHSFIVTGDIKAQWLRDSANQLSPYLPLASKDPALFDLFLGAIATHTEYVVEAPYCNAFQPPPISQIPPTQSSQQDRVHPAFEPTLVFECKWELDSLAHFLALANGFYEHTSSTRFVTKRWLLALDTILIVLDRQSRPTFDPDTARYLPNEYSWRRQTDSSTETLSLQGIGNPLNHGTGLIRSAFRPSDDSTILGFLLPANAMMAVELGRLASLLKAAGESALADKVAKRSQALTSAVWKHGVVQHKTHGAVFAYEIDGYGSAIFMDDANYPSLLALPKIGFLPINDATYQNTRKMLLDHRSNPYYLKGRNFEGIGGPHVGLRHAWPMSVLIQAQTSTDDDEIMDCLHRVAKVSNLGLIHESVSVKKRGSYTRSWFAWANGVFADTILDLAKRKPHLIFTSPAKAYKL